MPALLASFRSLVLPREHGSWSLALEPLALGLLVAPTRAGAWLALAGAAAFLSRRPLKLALTTPATDPRRPTALRWTALLTAVALVAFTFVASAPSPAILLNKQNRPNPAHSALTPGDSSPASVAILLNKQKGASATQGTRSSLASWWSPTSLSRLWPLLLAVPFGVAFLWLDLRGEMREAEAELCGSLTFALLPMAFATLAGWTTAPALALAAAMIGRSAPTVLTVRAFLRRAKGQRASAGPAWGAAFGGFAVLLVLWHTELVPPAAAVFAAIFALRSAWLLSRFAPAWSARRVGTIEAGLGLAFLVALTVAYRA